MTDIKDIIILKKRQLLLTPQFIAVNVKLTKVESNRFNGFKVSVSKTGELSYQ